MSDHRREVYGARADKAARLIPGLPQAAAVDAHHPRGLENDVSVPIDLEGTGCHSQEGHLAAGLEEAKPLVDGRG